MFKLDKLLHGASGTCRVNKNKTIDQLCSGFLTTAGGRSKRFSERRQNFLLELDESFTNRKSSVKDTGSRPSEDRPTFPNDS